MASLFCAGNTIYVRNDAVANDKVGSVEATDRDGTAPGNLVRYQIGEDTDGTAPGNLVRYQIGEERDGTAPGNLVRYQIGKDGMEQ
jgi:flagellar hook protein FlgE